MLWYLWVYFSQMEWQLSFAVSNNKFRKTGCSYKYIFKVMDDISKVVTIRPWASSLSPFLFSRLGKDQTFSGRGSNTLSSPLTHHFALPAHLQLNSAIYLRANSWVTAYHITRLAVSHDSAVPTSSIRPHSELGYTSAVQPPALLEFVWVLSKFHTPYHVFSTCGCACTGFAIL